MVREYFTFHIIKILDPEAMLRDLHKAIPNVMRLVVVQPSDTPKLTPTYLPVNPARFTHWNEFLVLDKKTTLPKVCISWFEKEDRLTISPNHNCRPQEMMRTVGWNSLAASTLSVFKGIYAHFDLDFATDVLFCGKPVSNILWNKIQKKSRGLGVEFHLFWQEYGLGTLEKNKVDKRDAKSPVPK
jgi:hypothetical protein